MLRKIQHVHFVGIGGSGMSGIAEVLLNLGYGVSGSDLAESTATRRLRQLGARRDLLVAEPGRDQSEHVRLPRAEAIFGAGVVAGLPLLGGRVLLTLAGLVELGERSLPEATLAKPGGA